MTFSATAARPLDGTHGWEDFKFHPEQARFWMSRARYQIAPAGRRSGKSAIARRKTIRAGLSCRYTDGRFVLAAPTRPHAKDLHWEALKRMVPKRFVAGEPEETSLTLRLKSGTKFQVMGLERPQRIEGTPLDGFLGDEWADVRPIAWTHHIRAALSTPGRPGWAMFIGVPEGRNHYYDLYRAAREGLPGWEAFHWLSADILDPAEIAAAKRELDPLVFAQEYEASFILFTGRAYYNYDPDIHAVERLPYDEHGTIDFCFDFNVDPGVCGVTQDFTYEGPNPMVEKDCVGVIGEVYIPRNSNTEAVCRKLIADWGEHKGDVRIYGDATGGARGSAKVAGSDWDIIKRMLRPIFGDRLVMRVPDANPFERPRINAVNSLFRSGAGTIRLLVDPIKAPRTARDFEGVQLLKGGSGEIDKAKHKDDGLTHLSDGVGYRVYRTDPTHDAGRIIIEQID